MQRMSSPSIRPIESGAARWQQRSSRATTLPLAPAIDHHGPFENSAGELPAVDQFVIPSRDIPGIAQKDSVIRHAVPPSRVLRTALLLCHLLGHRHFGGYPDSLDTPSRHMDDSSDGLARLGAVLRGRAAWRL